MTQLLDFPDELLCGIFKYLSPFDALHSFLNLNTRLNRLLMAFKQQIDFTYLSYQQFMHYINVLLPIINKDEPLYSMKLGNTRTPGQIDLFNTLMYDMNYRRYFNMIEKVIIESPRLDELIIFVENFLPTLSQLVTLSIKIDYIRDEHFQKWTRLVVNSLLSMTTLVNLSIEIPTGLVLSHLSNSLMLNSLIDLTLNITLVTDLLILIKRIPNVEYLKIRIGWWTSGDRTLVKMLDEMSLDTNRTSFLNKLKKFHLTIDSILTFQFEHLEQVLYRIMNNQTTYSFTFILRNCLNNNSELTQLIDGKQWEKVLSIYSSLTKLNFFIRITDSLNINDENLKIHRFQSKYFLSKKWFFSYFKYSIRGNILFYSIPYKNKELFDISINTDKIFHFFPINYASKLLIDQTNNNNTNYQSTFNFILNHFHSLQELHLNNFNMDYSIMKPINIPTLHTLKIEKDQNVNLFYLLQLLPLINTLFVSYPALSITNKSSENNFVHYDRIIELSLTNISIFHTDQGLVFLNQFPNVRFLHIHLPNRRMTDEGLLICLNEIINKFQLLTYFKLELDINVNSSIKWNTEFHGRVKMYLTDTIFDGILIHLWF